MTDPSPPRVTRRRLALPALPPPTAPWLCTALALSLAALLAGLARPAAAQSPGQPAAGAR
ncbi:hypothetical protein G3A44_20340, partial [Ideonella sp. TBM-1]|nr:hypothetical protein [Ideonella livida]